MFFIKYIKVIAQKQLILRGSGCWVSMKWATWKRSRSNLLAICIFQEDGASQGKSENIKLTFWIHGVEIPKSLIRSWIYNQYLKNQNKKQVDNQEPLHCDHLWPQGWIRHEKTVLSVNTDSFKLTKCFFLSKPVRLLLFPNKDKPRPLQVYVA